MAGVDSQRNARLERLRSVAPPAASLRAAAAPASPVQVSSGATAGHPPKSLLEIGPIKEVKLARHPMLSLFDLQRIAEEEELKKHPRKVRKKGAAAEKPLDSVAEVQGIITTERGHQAIVSGATVSEGDMVGDVKILKITETVVVMRYRGKTYRRSVRQ
jgi:hypothetical protein